MKSKKVSESITVMSQLMMPSDANNAGYVHGGVILAIADKVAGVCATRHAGKYCITASFDRVDFHKPIKIGQLVSFLASVNHVGNTSMEIGIRVESEDLLKCKKTHTNSLYVTMVAIDNKGKPTKVPVLIPETEQEKRRFKEGERRRKHRLIHLGKK